MDKIFKEYPIYLIHTLFLGEDENIKKIRKMKVGERIFV